MESFIDFRTVYNLTVAGISNFSVSEAGVLVHNCDGPAARKRAQEDARKHMQGEPGFGDNRYYKDGSRYIDSSSGKPIDPRDRRNPGPQHNYDIIDKNGNVRKTGVGSGLAENGYSSRAESQLEPGDTYRIRDRHQEGYGARGRAYDREQQLANEHYKNGEPMDKHQRPKPNY